MGLTEWKLQDLEASGVIDCYEDKALKAIWTPMVQWAYDCAKGAKIQKPRPDDVRAFLIQGLIINKPWKKCRDGHIKRPAKRWDEYWADYLLEKEWDSIKRG